VEPGQEAAPFHFATDEEEFKILQTIVASHWNPLIHTNRPGLLCCPVIEEVEWDSLPGPTDGPHAGHGAFWKSAPENLMTQLQQQADQIYASSDQTSGQLLFRASWKNFASMRTLFYSRPVLHDSGLMATVFLEVDTGYNSAEYRCCHLHRVQDGEWTLTQEHLTVIVN